MTAANEKIGVVGLGYVGMPLAAAFSAHFPVVGFDAKESRIRELQSGRDHTGEVSAEALRHPNLSFTADPRDLADCTFIVVAVPTPVTQSKDPDLTPLERASETVGAILRPGMLVAYESTVYPGVTEEICLPILEAKSGLKLGEFDLAYSPERVNPGDKQHTIEQIVKIVSGHDQKSCARAAAVYGAIIKAGIHQAPTIKTAEAAKVIENVQRDLNIALMNELSKIFQIMGLRTRDVLEAAGTKWNFHKYHPGLVGGHCIGVDPYYLTHRAVQLGYLPEVILSGRRINDSMGAHVGDLAIRALNRAGVLPRDARVWIMGMTFKEDVPDFRNTRAVDVVQFVRSYGAHVAVWEPMVEPEQIQREFGLETLSWEQVREIDAVILINAHKAFREVGLPALAQRMRTRILVDVKSHFDRDEARELGFDYISL